MVAKNKAVKKAPKKKAAGTAKKTAAKKPKPGSIEAIMQALDYAKKHPGYYESDL